MASNWLFSRCAVVGVFICVTALTAHAQESLFGSEEPAEQDPFGDPAAAVLAGPEGQPAAEKSVLAAEQPAVGEADHTHTHSSDLCRCVGEAESPAVERIEKALRGPLSSQGFDFTDSPLEEVVSLLQEQYGIPVKLNTNALEETGIDASEPVNIQLHNISFRSALRLMLKTLNLTYIIEDEVLLITTHDAAESVLRTCVYDVRDLLGDGGKDFDSLIDTIVSCVSTESWSENGGGESEIRPLPPGLLVVSQTQAVHEEISDLLTAIRELRDEHPPAADAASVQAQEDAKVVTRSYLLQINQEGNAGKLHDQVRRLIIQSMPDAQWDGRLDDGQPVVLTILADRVVLRHKPSIHSEVESLLVDSGVAAPFSETAAKTAGRSGSGEKGEGGGFFQVDPASRD